MFKNKKEVFDLLYDHLAPGGQLVLCKTVIKNEKLAEEKKDLIPDLDKMIHLDSLKPLLENAGFKDITFDFSNEKMRFELDLERPRQGMVKEHVQIGPERFMDPKLNFEDIDDVLGRVTIIATRD